MANRDLTTQLLTLLDNALAPHGFKRSGRRFRRSLTDTVQIIELQKSTASTSGNALVRLNLGSFLVPLGPAEALEGNGPHHSECHWRDYLDPQPMADWWSLNGDADIQQVADQMTTAIKARLLPEMDELSSVAGFVKRWRGGRGTGITRKQQDMYLAQLTRHGSA